MKSEQASRTDQRACAAGSEPEHVQACACARILRTFEACSSVLLGSSIWGRSMPSGPLCIAAWTNLQHPTRMIAACLTHLHQRSSTEKDRMLHADNAVG